LVTLGIAFYFPTFLLKIADVVTYESADKLSDTTIDLLTNGLLLPHPQPRETLRQHLISKKGYCGRINYI